jgi:hypothetical protein
MPSNVDPVFGCDLVTSRLDRDGYAFHGKTRAHIVAWVGEHGAVPEGLVLDHLCRRRNCRAVHHLEPVTQSENEKRKRFAYRMRRKVCQFGHDLTVARVLTPEGGVVCRTCNQKACASSTIGTDPA